jgi:hypothetical protein
VGLQVHRLVVVAVSILVLSAVALIATAAAAVSADGPGWSADAGGNLVVADRPRDQVQVKLAPTLDGGFYVSWYDDAGGGYDPTLQRVDEAGVEQWAHNGINLADTGFSWVTDYSLAVTADDDALVAFRDDRGGERITMTRITLSGTPVWGARGITVADPAEFLGPPKIVSTADNQIAIAWTRNTEIWVRRYTLDGKAVPNSDMVFADSTATQYLADLQPTADGGLIVSWVHTESFSAPRHLWAQKIARDGKVQWGPVLPGGHRPLVVFDAGTLQYGNFPPFIEDGEGGAVFAWYETDPVLQVRVQHVRADGKLVFPEDGATTTVGADRAQRVEPAMTYDLVTGDIYVFWRESYDSGPLDQWMYGQRFDADGERMWGDKGREIEPHGAHEVTQLQAEAYQGGVLVAFVEKLAEGDQRVWIRYLDEDGESIWDPQRVAVSTVPSGKSRLDMAISGAEFAALGWQDTRGGSEDIYLQNVKSDGSLGPFDGPPPTGTTPPPTTAVPTTPPPSTGPPTLVPTEAPSPTVVPTESIGMRIYLPAALRSIAIGPAGVIAIGPGRALALSLPRSAGTVRRLR